MKSVSRFRVGAVLMAISAMGLADARAQAVQFPAVAAHEAGPQSHSLLHRRVNLHIESVPLGKALETLRARSGVTLAFSPSLLPTEKLVDCACEGVDVETALSRLLTGTNFHFTEFGHQILLEPRPASDVSRPTGPATSLTERGAVTHRTPALQGVITGIVVRSPTGEPLAGAQVSVVGTSLGAVTDAAGRFSIQNVTAGQVTIRAQMLGYRTSEQVVQVVAGGVVTVRFTLDEEILALDEIIVTGTAGQARRREVGNTISQIRMDQVAAPVVNLDAVLQGRDASMLVSPGSATMGAGAQIRLRGNTSVSMSNQPIIYIDGVRQTADGYPRNWVSGQTSSTGSNSQASPLNDINPADIERVEIIKGAAATTLYGTEAAAGVIQIFTKRGATGRATWTFQTDQSFTRIQKFGSKQRPYVGLDPWLRTGYGQKYNLSVSGGTPEVRYFLSGIYQDGEGVLPTDEENRVGLRANLTFHPTQTLSLEWSSLYSNYSFVNGPHGAGGESLFFNVYRAPINSVGSDKKEDLDRLLELELPSQNVRANFGLTAHWTTRPWFTNRFSVGYDQANALYRQVRPFGYVLKPEGEIAELRWTSGTLTLDHVGTLDFGLTDDLRARLSFGGQLIQTAESRIDGSGSGLPGPGRFTLSNTASRVLNSSEQRVNTGGLFVQSLLSSRDRYFLTLGVRFDGSSAFGKDFGLQAYPKISGSYVISDESFWREEWGTWKLRAAYGNAGRAPGAFDAVRTWSSFSFANQVAFITQNIGNPKLGPERTAEIELGFDGSIFDDRLGIDFTYYKQHTRDALFPVAQPPSQGFLGSQLENVGELTNEGIELTVNGNIINGETFRWDAGLGVSLNRSEILDVGSSTSYMLVPGQPAPVIRGTKVLNPNEYADPILEQDAFFGPNSPTHTFTANTRIELPRGIALSARGEYQGGHWMREWPSMLVAQRGPQGAVGCDAVYQRVPWAEYTGPGDTHPNLHQVRALDRARCYRSTVEAMWAFPADFFKLREVSLQVPVSSFVPGANQAMFTASAYNIWRWVNSEFVSFDPEIVTFGNQITALERRVYDQLPPPATLSFSLRVSF